MPVKYNLSIYRGDSKTLQLLLWSDTANTQPVDLTGVTALSEIRNAIDGNVVGQFTCTVVLPNIVNCVLVPAVSQNLTPKGVWDVQLTYTDGSVTSPVYGTVTVTPDVTNSNP